jgi:GNAT superfamily N-acetyltransferase
MPVTFAPLGPAHVGALRALLTRDLPHNLYLLGLMEEFGVVCGPERAPFRYVGRFSEAGELTAALFLGGDGGLVVPSASSLQHIVDIARSLAGQVTLRSCVGEKSLVDALVLHFGATPGLSRQLKLYSVSADDLGPFTNPNLRQATEGDLPRLVPLAAACVAEVLRRDPLAEDPDGFAVRVRQRVASGRTYVLEANGRLVFKVDVGSRSQYGADLEGLYTVPEARRQGHATLCLGQISRFLLSSLPRLTLRVDESSPCGDIARRVGYLAGRAQRLVWA